MPIRIVADRKPTTPHVEKKAKSKRKEAVVKAMREKLRKSGLPKRPDISKWKALGSPKKGKAGESKTKWFNKGGRTGKASGGRIGKQFGGGLSRPLGGAGMPARPLGGMRAPVGAMGPRRFGMKHGSKKK